MKNSLKNRIDGGSKHPLAFAIYDTYRFEFILAGVLQLTSSVMQVVSPFLLRYLIQFASDAWVAKKTGEPAPRISTGMGYVLGVTLMQVVMSMATNHFIFRGMMVGGQSRAALISLIFEKAIKSLFARRKAINKITDQRVSLTQEILQSVRFVKFFGWENAFMNRLQGIRSIEIRHIQTLMAIRSGINAVSMSMPAFASMLAFITYTLTNHNMQAAQIFSSLALFNSLRMPLNLFPMVLGNVIDAWSSVKRIQEYLLAEEMEEDVRVDKTSKHAMELNRASFTWEQTQAQAPETSAEEMAKNNAMQTDNHIEDHSADRQAFRLDNLNISFGRNELVAVIGSVGSGKTSLLSALAGDMRKTGGEVVLGADRAFCPQYAWVQNATLQKNILFGKPMNKAWYEEVIHACALQPDLEMLPSGDQTEIDVMDNALGDAMRMYLFTVSMILGVFGLIIAYFHWFAVALAPLAALFFFSAGYYRSSAREVKRFESVLRSDVFARFSEGLSGVASIRAYGLKAQFLQELRESVDEMNAAYFLTFSNQRWLAVRLDFVGCLLVFTCGTLVVTSRFSVSPSIGGLVLSYILSIVQMIQFTVRQLAEVENGMNAVERLNHYGTNLEEEAPLHTIEVPPKWPEKGEIVFENVEMRYRADLPLVLRGLSIHVQGGERIGIIGRTGAGKSSIMSTLFRLVEISSGKITLDGLNISTLGLHELRSRMAIIPQDPTLFHGTVRSNLDPFHEHTDLELWSALRQAGLSTESGSSESSPTSASALDSEKAEPTNNDASSGIHLDTVVEEEGLNFSLGQRQLMALARALVRNSQVIVCDEATSSVDVETDDRIQHTIATAFKGRTLLCIAHRLRTIVGYDRICVMDRGQIAQLDTPLNLWKDEDGIFRSMCERSGIRLEDIRRDSEE
ncbi:Oligomycin resistance ATP-dependent permease YOR1 [Ceratocystis platani]|uniref:Oligomycin resistance ATP-dependent permease YOR1 n=1 Tax=Ceratocystis fimbriata f. sp. platani TaxID=88771 RepID=A0A0F8B2R0_CERFI|nr:Oligomycin resistance ATP-dependent permease YOR1 [Ceratocystis platani]